MGAEEGDGLARKDRSTADGDVERIRLDLLAPRDFPVEVDGGDDGGGEDHEDMLAVGGRRGGRVTAAGAAAEVLAPPGAGVDRGVPREFAVGGLVAGDVVFGHDLGILLAAGPADGAEEDLVAPDDGARVALADEGAFPGDVLAFLAAPGEG